ncbi:MAG: VacJ family lipoprotein [Caulobacterales bacterium]
MRPSSLAAVIGLMVLSLAPACTGPCAAAPQTAPAARASNPDPWERSNRQLYAFHNALDRALFRPAALFLERVLPGPAGDAVHSFLTNLREPVVVLNDTLQLRFGAAGRASARFVANSTIGLLGFIDVAGHAGIPHHDNDFGITLGRYGFASGPYLFIPLFGPTTVRDGVGRAVDLFIDPFNAIHYHAQLEFQASRTVLGGLDLRARSEGELDALLGNAADPYATLRSAYLQDRQGQIRGGEVPELPPIDDPAAPASSASASTAGQAAAAPTAVVTAEPTAGADGADASEIIVTWGTSDDGPPTPRGAALLAAR